MTRTYKQRRPLKKSHANFSITRNLHADADTCTDKSIFSIRLLMRLAASSFCFQLLVFRPHKHHLDMTYRQQTNK